MKSSLHSFIEEKVTVDGVAAVRRRAVKSLQKTHEPYLHIPMTCIMVLSEAKIPATAWSLALWIIWHYIVSSGKSASISASFASKAGITDRPARRYAVNALEASGLFDVSRHGKEAAKVAPRAELKATLRRK